MRRKTYKKAVVKMNRKSMMVGVLDVTKDKTEVARFIWKKGKYVRVKPLKLP